MIHRIGEDNMQEGDDSQINVEDTIERMVMIISGMVRMFRIGVKIKRGMVKITKWLRKSRMRANK
jgi:hypothetical protein